MQDANVPICVPSKALDMHMAVCILRVPGGLDYSKFLADGEELKINGGLAPEPSVVMMGGMSTASSFVRTRQNSQESLAIPHNNSFYLLSPGEALFPVLINSPIKNVKSCQNDFYSTVDSKT